jgi:Zn-dependent metalloprotease
MSKITKTARDQQIIEALGSELKAATTITLNGEVYKAKDLQQQFQAEVDAAKATQSAKTAYAQAVLAEEKVAAQVTLIRKALRAYLIGVFGANSATVAAFGFTPKEATVDVATKADAIAKRTATRAARGTKGSRQKKEITGAAPAASTGSTPVIPAINSITPKIAATS